MSATGAVLPQRAASVGAVSQRQRTSSNARASASLPHVSAQRNPALRGAPHAQRLSVRAKAASGSKERGEWSKFLSLESKALQANVDWRYIDDGKAVELVITAPDRPGLLVDLTSAISAEGLNIDQARVTTPEPGKSAKDTFLVRAKDGAELTDAKVNDIKTAILATIGKGKPQPAIALDKAEPISFLMSAVQADTAVEVLSFEPPGKKPGFIITFQTTDRPGVLARISLALHDLGLEILGAEIKTKGGFVSNKFQTSRAPGKNRQQLEDAIKEKMKGL